jgi:hypothetical protein
MTSTGDGGGVGPLDPDFAGLFRPEDHDPSAPAPPAPAEDVPQPAAAPRVETPGAEPASSAPPSSGPVDTGRLFRSQGVAGHSEAVLALSSDHFGRLRTLERDTDLPAPVPRVPATPEETTDGENVQAPIDAAAAPTAVDGLAMSTSAHRTRRGRTIKAGAVYLVVIGVTVLVGFANALLSDGTIGWPTGVALLISSVYAALVVRRQDDTVAFIVPPVAFLLAAITAGQVFIDSLEGSVINRAVVLFFTLAENWMWIIGSTLAALVIVLVRRRRA